MEKILIRGGNKLEGTIRISGAKNAILPILTASLLAEEGETILEEVPGFDDVDIICEVLRHLGAKVEKIGVDGLRINSQLLNNSEAPYDYVRKMRASFLTMGPLLGRLGKAKIPLPGGCAIGTRPIDLHLKGFMSLGTNVVIGHGCVQARAKRLKGSRVYLDFPSVGATENIMMAAVLAQGETLIENCAEEPEIVDLARFLNKMGAKIEGAGTGAIYIEGVKKLKGVQYRVIPDRIEAGTYMVAAAATRGNVLIENVLPETLKPVIAKLRESGVEIKEEGHSIRIIGQRKLHPVDIKTLPYPGFPTDMQAQMMVFLTQITGTSVVTETVFENRFMHVPELKRMGGAITIEGRNAIIKGKNKLSGTRVKATDLRAGASLIIAGLLAEGETEINDIYHIRRGYDRIEQKLKNVGVDIELINS